jgi:hypothetical protein
MEMLFVKGCYKRGSDEIRQIICVEARALHPLRGFRFFSRKAKLRIFGYPCREFALLTFWLAL